MALPKQLKAARMSNATVGTTIDTEVGALESALCDIFGFTPDVDITASPFSLDNSGRITKALIAQRAAGPVGWRFRDTTSGKEMRVCVNGANMDFDENTGSEAAPAWTNRFRIVIATGVLSGITFSSARQGLAPQSSGVATEFLNAAAGYTVPTSGSGSAARARHSANQSILSSTLAVVACDTEDYDTDTMHSTSTDNGRLTIKTAGKYRIVGSVGWAANATGIRQLGLALNGSSYIAFESVRSAGASAATYMHAQSDYDLALGAYIDMRVFQDSGGALNVLGGLAYTPVIQAHRIG